MGVGHEVSCRGIVEQLRHTGVARQHHDRIEDHGRTSFDLVLGRHQVAVAQRNSADGGSDQFEVALLG